MMNQIIKPEYTDTWFAVPKVMVEGYMPMISINALSLYIILSCFQDSDGIITKPLIELKNISGLRSITMIHTLEYLKSKKLVYDVILDNNTRALELAFKPQPRKRKKLKQ
jgi:hypothetical protein